MSMVWRGNHPSSRSFVDGKAMNVHGLAWQPPQFAIVCGWQGGECPWFGVATTPVRDRLWMARRCMSMVWRGNHPSSRSFVDGKAVRIHGLAWQPPQFAIVCGWQGGACPWFGVATIPIRDRLLMARRCVSMGWRGNHPNSRSFVDGKAVHVHGLAWQPSQFAIV